MADFKRELNAEVGTFSDVLLGPMKLSLGNEASEEIDRYLGDSKVQVSENGGINLAKLIATKSHV